MRRAPKSDEAPRLVVFDLRRWSASWWTTPSSSSGARNIEQGMSGPQAAIRAMAQLPGPVLGITLVLMSVFLPAAFVPGLTGRMYAQFDVEIDRVKAEALHLTPDQVSTAISAYLGSSYVDQFNKFGRTFQIYVQADAPYRLKPQDVTALQVRNQQGDMVPLGTLVKIVPATGPSLISLYNLYPSASVVGLPAPGFSSGDAMALMEQIAARTLPPGVGYEWTAMSYQEKAAGRQVYYVFALALLLVYLVLAGQYESWWTPLSVILAVPLALLGPAAVLTSLGVDNNLYVQIGLVLLIALSAKNAILIVEVARELRLGEGATLAAAAVEAARLRFRPILMTSLAFILGMAPLVVATGAGASARKSIGVAVTSGMLASTCLAVLFVPAFFVVIQGFEEWRLRRRRSAGRMPPDHA